MKRITTITITAVALGMVVSLASLAAAQRQGRHGPGEGPPRGPENHEQMFDRLADRLELTDDQLDTYDQLVADHLAVMQALHEKMKQAREDFEADLQDILTEDQLTRFKDMKQRMEERRQGMRERMKERFEQRGQGQQDGQFRPRNGRGGPGGPRGLMQALQQLDLTDQQKQELRELGQDLRGKMRNVEPEQRRELFEDFREQVRTIIGEENAEQLREMMEQRRQGGPDRHHGPPPRDEMSAADEEPLPAW